MRDKARDKRGTRDGTKFIPSKRSKKSSIPLTFPGHHFGSDCEKDRVFFDSTIILVLTGVFRCAMRDGTICQDADFLR